MVRVSDSSVGLACTSARSAVEEQKQAVLRVPREPGTKSKSGCRLRSKAQIAGECLSSEGAQQSRVSIARLCKLVSDYGKSPQMLVKLLT